MNAEFFAAVEDIEKEKGIPRDYMYEKIQQALLAAFRKDNPDFGENVEVICDEEKKRIDLIVHMTVVEQVEDPTLEIDVESAKKYSKKAAPGDELSIPVETKQFGRIAAQNVMKGELATGYTVKAASNLLDEELFVKEKPASESLFDMSSATLTDGDYTATVDGQEGPMTVAVTIADGKIASVEVTENKETEAIAGPALEKVPAAIVESNSLDVDGVAGATLSSNRIKKAVAQCLEQAAG